MSNQASDDAFDALLRSVDEAGAQLDEQQGRQRQHADAAAPGEHDEHGGGGGDDDDIDAAGDGFGGGGGGDPNGLIPMCIMNPGEPTFRPEIFGYDIARIAERPWTRPGANLAEYFNYGFDEASWRVYCALQHRGASSLRARADAFLEKVIGDLQLARGGPSAATAAGGSATATMSGPATANTMDGNGGMYRGATGGLLGDGAGMMGARGAPGVAASFGPGGAAQAGFSGPSVSYLKTRLCHQFMSTGSCPMGANCRFAHGESDLRPLGLPRMRPPMAGAVPGTYYGGGDPAMTGGSGGAVPGVPALAHRGFVAPPGGYYGAPASQTGAEASGAGAANDQRPLKQYRAEDDQQQ